MGTRLMASTPPPMTTSMAPGHDRLGGEVDRLLGRAALAVDGRARARVSGNPAASAALRPMFMACSPTVIVQPRTTSSTRAGSRSLRSTRARSGCAARSTACQPDSRPLRLPDRGADDVDDHGVGHRHIVTHRRWLPEIRAVCQIARRRPSPGARHRPRPIRRGIHRWTCASPRQQEEFRAEARAWLASPCATAGLAALARHRRGVRGPPGLGADHVRRPVVGGVVARASTGDAASGSSNGCSSRRSTGGPGPRRG